MDREPRGFQFKKNVNESPIFFVCKLKHMYMFVLRKYFLNIVISLVKISGQNYILKTALMFKTRLIGNMESVLN